MDIVPFDPHAASPTKWTAFHAFRRVRAAEDDPGEPVLSDADVAALLSYVRAAWGQHAAAVTPLDVSRARGAAN